MVTLPGTGSWTRKWVVMSSTQGVFLQMLKVRICWQDQGLAKALLASTLHDIVLTPKVKETTVEEALNAPTRVEAPRASK